MSLARPITLGFHHIVDSDGAASPSSARFTDDTTASYNLFQDYKTPRPSAHFSAMPSNSDGNDERATERSDQHRRRFDRVSTKFELLRGLRMGERYPYRPAPYSGYVRMHKKKMFGRSSRYCVLKDGYLFIYRHAKEVDKGRIWRQIDLAHSVVSYRRADYIILINTDDNNELHRMKVNADVFDEWVENIRVQRLFRQDQFAGDSITDDRLVTVPAGNTPRTPATEYGLDTDMNSVSSKRRVEEWLQDTEITDSKEREFNEASVLIFDLGNIIEQLEKYADMASDRQPAVEEAAPPKIESRSFLGRLSFRSRSHGRPENNEDVRKVSTPSPSRRTTLQIPTSLSTRSFQGGSSPDVQQAQPTPPPSTASSRRLIREESDIFHRDTWLREEYLRLAKEAHKKLRSLLRAINAEESKFRTLQQQQRTDIVSGPSSPSRTMAHDGNAQIQGGDKPASIIDDPRALRTSSSVYYDAKPFITNQSSAAISDVASTYTPSDIESDNDEQMKEDEDEGTSDQNSSNGKDAYVVDDYNDASSRPKMPAMRLPQYRERLPAPMPPPPSLFSMLRRAIGRDFARFPLPVSALEPLGLLQVLCEELEYSELIDQAVNTTDPSMRMVFVAAFAASRYGSTTYRIGRKPFNPLLGETFEFVSPNLGWHYVAEQVSHHPPVSACYAEGRGWRWWQDAEAAVVFGGRSVEAKPLTPVFLNLRRWNETYVWNKATTYLANLFSGPPYTMDHYGEMVIQCAESHMKCKMHFEKMNSTRDRGNLNGKVFDANGQVLHTIYGKWTDSLFLDGPPDSASRCIWRLAALPPEHERYYGYTRFALALNELRPEIHGHLPITDTRYRPDQRFLENGRLDDAEHTKKKLETEQRERKNMREEGRPLPPLPLWFNSTGKDGQSSSKWEFSGDYWQAKSRSFEGAQFTKLW